MENNSFSKSKKLTGLIIVTLALFVSMGIGQIVKFGVIADIHHGYLSDVNQRMQIFIDEMEKDSLDFIIQLGDFTLHPTQNQSGSFLAIWNSYSGSKYHVLGNHDMDNASKAEVRSYWGMNENNYFYEINGYRFIVLDANHIKFADNDFRDFDNGNYYAYPNERDYLGPTQLQWFKDKMDSTDLHLVAFSHQQLLEGRGAKDAADYRQAIEQLNTAAGYDKFVLSLNGHGHDDVGQIINGIPYVEIPTTSHDWVPGTGAVPYTTVRYAVVTLDATLGKVNVDGFSIPFDYQNKGTGDSSIGTITDRNYDFKVKSTFQLPKKSNTRKSATIFERENDLIIEISSNLKNGTQIKIFDLLGNIILENDYLSTSITILPKTNFKKGVYIFSISQSGKIFNHLFSIN